MQLDLVDVFAAGPLTGNPLAVVHGGEGLEAADMLRITRWLGFSETTFLLPPTDPGADYRVRIFYPAGELPFAGHPTLGTAHAWLAAGGVPKQAGRIVQECGIGLVDVRQESGMLAFRAPPLLRSGALDPADLAETIRLCGVNERDVVAGVHAANGPGWKVLHMASDDAVLAAEPAARAPLHTDVALLGPRAADGGPQWELRAFFADASGRLCEDPVTGSLNAGIARWLLRESAAPDRYVISQGTVMGRAGRVQVERVGDALWIGGACVTCIEGTVTL